MKEWKVPVVWEACGIVYVKANTLEEAIEKAIAPETPLPDDYDYVADSCECWYDDIDSVRDLNDGQEDDIDEEIV